MNVLDFELLNWLNDRENIRHNLASSCLTFLRLTDIPGYDPASFDLMLDCGTDRGDGGLVRAIAEGYGVGEGEVAVTSSASEGNFLVESLFSDRDIAVESPCYEPLRKLAAVLHAREVTVPRPYGNGFRFHPEVLKERIRGCGLLVMTNLHNPSGVEIPPAELREVIEICADAGAVVLVDEIFRHFSDAPSAISLGENVVINASPSKFFGACGLRIGHLVGPETLIRDIQRLKMLISPNTSVISQRAYLLMMRNLEWFIRRGRHLMAPNMALLSEWIASRDDVAWIPSMGNIAFPRILDPATGNTVDTLELGRCLKRHHGVLVTPGILFGPEGEGHIRIGYGIPPEQLSAGLVALEAGLDDLAAEK